MGKKELNTFQYGNYAVMAETELLPNGDKKITSRKIKGKLTNCYDNVRLKYCFQPDKVLTLEEFFNVIVGDRFKNKDYVMVVYRGYDQERHCNSMDELLYYAKWAEHFCPNTFYKWETRSAENLRCLQWMVFDFELRQSNGKAFSPLQVWEIFRREIGFTPRFIKESETKGSYHVGLQHTTVNGKTESVYLFNRIQAKIAKKIGTDEGANGGNHLYSIPKKDQKIFYFAGDPIDFNDLKNWWLQQLKEENKKTYTTSGKVTSLTEHMLWNHDAIKALQEHEFDGSRNQAAFTLALLHYALGKTKEETEDYLLNKWYPYVDQKGKPYRLSELRASIKSAYSGKYMGPSKERIEALTGIEFNLRIYRGQYQRSIRHNMTENQQAIIGYFRDRGGKVEMMKKELIEDICQTQESPLGKKFAFKSIERNLDKLKKERVIDWESKGSGGNAKAKITEFVLKDGIYSDTTAIIEEDHNVYVLGKVVDLN
ncbi:hypothetical protein NLX67_21275 [Domibacillus sp. A3M-37]|uniref:hypothetical protein n=1 Tax=Domibacillus sp. A3M-37 TaxID=2962037 RepID=UPI0020B82588|nr:hypothetical protein [Domibacillus sp. A3M-37]MCP3764855.1 hypothetical protein [Domibacillus sp. A3M-37]